MKEDSVDALMALAWDLVSADTPEEEAIREARLRTALQGRRDESGTAAKCPHCGHKPHAPGYCFNMASDDDCECESGSQQVAPSPSTASAKCVKCGREASAHPFWLGGEKPCQTFVAPSSSGDASRVLSKEPSEAAKLIYARRAAEYGDCCFEWDDPTDGDAGSRASILEDAARVLRAAYAVDAVQPSPQQDLIALQLQLGEARRIAGDLADAAFKYSKEAGYHTDHTRRPRLPWE